MDLNRSCLFMVGGLEGKGRYISRLYLAVFFSLLRGAIHP